jgi:hypothetical protein
VDLSITDAASIVDMARSLDPGAPVVLINASTLEHHLMWTELDANATNEASRALIIRQGESGGEHALHRRAPADEGRKQRSHPAQCGLPRVPRWDADRRALQGGAPAAHGRDLHDARRGGGRAQRPLPRLGLHGRESAQHHRAHAFYARRRIRAPGWERAQFHRHAVENDVDSNIFRRVTGTYEVERYVDSLTPPARFALGPDGLPVHQATPQVASFICNIPRAALAPAPQPPRPRGLRSMGTGCSGRTTRSRRQRQAMATNTTSCFCATKWIGMADEDVQNAIAILQDLGSFPASPTASSRRC